MKEYFLSINDYKLNNNCELYSQYTLNSILITILFQNRLQLRINSEKILNKKWKIEEIIYLHDIEQHCNFKIFFKKTANKYIKTHQYKLIT